MKKDIDYYMKLNYRIEILKDKENDSYVINFPDLSGCISSGTTIESAYNNVLEAKKIWLEAALEDFQDRISEPQDYQYSGQFKLRIPKGLHRRLAERARAEGVSMNQYCATVLSRYA